MDNIVEILNQILHCVILFIYFMTMTIGVIVKISMLRFIKLFNDVLFSELSSQSFFLIVKSQTGNLLF